jgi:phage tail protein X
MIIRIAAAAVVAASLAAAPGIAAHSKPWPHAAVAKAGATARR